MYLLLVILMLIASVLMCFIVLIQNSKGGGSGIRLFIIRTKLWVCARLTEFFGKSNLDSGSCMVVFSIVSAYTIPSSTGKGGDVILEQAQQEEKTNPYNMPVGTEAPQSEAPAATTPAEAPAPAAEAPAAE